MGKVFKYGDNVDTDVIIPARYLTTSDPEVLAKYAMHDIDEDFAGQVKEGDFIVAGSNFGSGSSREHAPIAIKAAGVECVIAKNFARIFYRNSFNIGLPILESDEAVEAIDDSDEIEVDYENGIIKNITKDEEYQSQVIPPFMQEILDAGGLVNFVKEGSNE